METVLLSITKSELQQLIAEAVTACLRANQPLAQTPQRTGNATRKQAAKYLGITLPTLHKHTKAGSVKGNYVGIRVLYRWEDLDAAMSVINAKRK